MTVLLLILIGFGIVATQIRKPRLFIVLSVGYLINLALIFTQRYVRPVFYSSDQQRFLDYANELYATDFLTFLMLFDPTGSYVISWFAAIVFKVLGNDLLYVNFFFVYAWIGTVIYLHKLAMLITGSKNFAFIITLFLIFIPSVSIVNAAFLRESFIIFFLVLSVNHTYIWYMTRNLRFFITSIVFMTFAGFFHGVFYFIAAFLILFYMKESLLRFNIRYSNLFMVFVLVIVLVHVTFKLAGNVKVEMAFSLLMGEERVLERYASIKDDSSNFEGINTLVLPSLDFSNPVYLIASMVQRVVVFSYSPFIHHYHKITDIPRIYDSIIFVFSIMIFFLIYKNGRKYNDQRIDFYFKLFVPIVLLLLLMFSIGSFDVGTSQRHRLKFMTVFMIVTFSMFYVTRSLAKNRRRGAVGG